MKPLGSFPFDALVPHLEHRLPEMAIEVNGRTVWIPAASDQRVAELIGVCRRTVVRWRAGQLLNHWNADQAATRLGLYPTELWPTWADTDLALEAS